MTCVNYWVYVLKGGINTIMGSFLMTCLAAEI